MATKKLPKPRIWSQDRADKEISLWIRKRDGQCQYPSCTATESLQCSHYVGRATNSTRYWPDNLITLCRWHHYGSKLLGFEYQKQRKELHGYDGQYTLFMKRLLGTIKFKELCDRSRVSMKGSNAILELMYFLNKL